MGEPNALQLGEGRQEVSGQGTGGRLALFVVRAHPVAEVVQRVPPTPQDSVVGGEAVVVELVAHVGQSLPAHPAQGRQLRRRQGLSSQYVVVDRCHPLSDGPNRRSVGVSGHYHPVRCDRAVVGPDPNAAQGGLQRPDGAVVVEADAQALGSAPQAPSQAGRVQHHRAVGYQQPGPVYRRVDPGPGGRGVKQGGLDAVGEVNVHGIGQLNGLPVGDGDVQLTGPFGSAVDVVAVDGGHDVVQVLIAESDQVGDLVGPVGHPVLQAVGE